MSRMFFFEGFTLQRREFYHVVSFMPNDKLNSAVAEIADAVEEYYGRLVRRVF
nr:hypothetical protein [Turneriella parva]